MLGSLIGFDSSGWVISCAVIGAALVSAYCLLGAGWLIIKSEGELQLQAVALGAVSLFFTMAVLPSSIATQWSVDFTRQMVLLFFPTSCCRFRWPRRAVLGDLRSLRRLAGDRPAPGCRSAQPSGCSRWRSTAWPTACFRNGD
jgi:hypothetical protein